MILSSVLGNNSYLKHVRLEVKWKEFYGVCVCLLDGVLWSGLLPNKFGWFVLRVIWSNLSVCGHSDKKFSHKVSFDNESIKISR